MFAYDYPLLGMFWTILIVFLWIAWIMLLIRVFADIFRSDDMGGFAKAIWSIFVIIAPFLGVLVYLIARGDSMTRRDIKDAQAADAAMRAYVREAAGTEQSTASELSKLAELRDRGVLSADEFEQQKARLLAG